MRRNSEATAFYCLSFSVGDSLQIIVIIKNSEIIGFG